MSAFSIQATNHEIDLFVREVHCLRARPREHQIRRIVFDVTQVEAVQEFVRDGVPPLRLWPVGERDLTVQPFAARCGCNTGIVEGAGTTVAIQSRGSPGSRMTGTREREGRRAGSVRRSRPASQPRDHCRGPTRSRPSSDVAQAVVCLEAREVRYEPTLRAGCRGSHHKQRAAQTRAKRVSSVSSISPRPRRTSGVCRGLLMTRALRQSRRFVALGAEKRAHTQNSRKTPI